MAKSNEIAAGMVMWDIIDGIPKILLCHMGGPYFSNSQKHPRAWGIPKGHIEGNEKILDTAIREFEEETGIKAIGPFESIGNVVYKNGKTVHAFAFRGSFPGKINSNFFEMEWPPKSGVMKKFPENDRGEMFDIDEARTKIMVSQEPFVDKMIEIFKNKNLLK